MCGAGVGNTKRLRVLWINRGVVSARCHQPDQDLHRGYNRFVNSLGVSDEKGQPLPFAPWKALATG